MFIHIINYSIDLYKKKVWCKKMDRLLAIQAELLEICKIIWKLINCIGNFDICINMDAIQFILEINFVLIVT